MTYERPWGQTQLFLLEFMVNFDDCNDFWWYKKNHDDCYARITLNSSTDGNDGSIKARALFHSKSFK